MAHNPTLKIAHWVTVDLAVDKNDGEEVGCTAFIGLALGIA